MKCSGCKFWKTEKCKLNPDAEDLDYAETFACFIPISGEDGKEQEIKTNTVSHIGLILFILGIIGFILVAVLFPATMRDLEPGGSGSGWGGFLLIFICPFISIVLFLVGLVLWLGWYKFK